MRTRCSLIRWALLAGAVVIMGSDARAQVATTTPANHEGGTASTNSDEAAVREAEASFLKAYNAGDAKALSELFVDDSEIIDSDGVAVRGRGDIAAMYAQAFNDTKGMKLEATIDRIRFVTPDVARIEGHSVFSSREDESRESGTFAGLLVRRDKRWRYSELRDYMAAPADDDVSPYDRLKELEWMVGDWVDEGGSARVHSSVRWAVNRSFLIRTYNTEGPGTHPMDRTMFIGWDPESAQIKSWLFDSEGGHGEGFWTRVAENRWVIEASGMSRAGEPHSATVTHTLDSKDYVKTSSVDRIIGGVAAPDVSGVVMVRRAPVPRRAKPDDTPRDDAK